LAELVAERACCSVEVIVDAAAPTTFGE
jgi:hypothetical protein